MISDKDTLENIMNAAEGAARASFMRALVEIDSAEIEQASDLYGFDQAQSEMVSHLAGRFLQALHRGYEHSGGARVADVRVLANLNR